MEREKCLKQEEMSKNLKWKNYEVSQDRAPTPQKSEAILLNVCLALSYLLYFPSPSNLKGAIRNYYKFA